MARMRRVNEDGVIHTIRAVAPRMQERGYGRIVNIGSNAAIGTALPRHDAHSRLPWPPGCGISIHLSPIVA
jgi:NADP-dependent 3-hydroxy acid dehydrogenase YdfG